MIKTTLIAGVVSVTALATAYAQDKSQECTEAHFQQMDTQVSQLTDESKKKEAKKHLQMSKDAFKKGDTQACLQHMEQAHLAMGITGPSQTGGTKKGAY